MAWVHDERLVSLVVLSCIQTCVLPCVLYLGIECAHSQKLKDREMG